MQGKYESLFTPMQIGSLTIKNRIILCAMGGTSPFAHGSLNFVKNTHPYFVERAKANVGLLIPGVTLVKEISGEWLHDAEDVFMGPVKAMVEEIHSYGSKFFLQLGAGFGRVQVVTPSVREQGLDLDDVLVSASDGVPNVWDPTIKHRGLRREEILEIIDAFAKSAVLCKAAGIDGVEIHAVHEGYLLDQFAMACSNNRTDEYGGSLENRLRFATDIIKAIKAACGEDYPVSVRYSVANKMRGYNAGAIPGEDYVEFGRSMEESPAAARILEAAGADMLNSDNGSYDSWYWAHPPVYMPMACNLPEVSYIKQFVDIPVVCAGRMDDPDIAAEVIEKGIVDGVGVARQLLADPYWLDKIRDGKLDDIRPCIACHNGCFPFTTFKGMPISFEGKMGVCALNPLSMREEEMVLIPTQSPKKVAVIGGGIGGMEAARLCKMRGHDVTLYEKSGVLGGVFISAAAPSFKEKDKMLINWYIKQLKDLNIDIKFNAEITKDSLKDLDVDEIIIATGSTPRKLPVPGFDGANTIEAIDYLLNRKEAGDRVVIIGGGLTGCEIAYDLILKGKKPVIVEMQDDIMKIIGLSAANSNMMREILRYNEIDIRVSTLLSEIKDDGVLVKTGSTEEFIPADTVILSVGYNPYVPFASDDVPDSNIHVIGDANKIGNLYSVIEQAYSVAYKI